MTYIEYMNQLWRSALLSPLPASEIALFAYLVNESNKRYWKMPFACSTTRICEDLRLSRQTVITARKHLSERKLIAFTEGKSRHLPSNYTLLEWTDNLTVGLTDNLTHGLTQDLTHIKDKDKHQSKDSFIRVGVRFLTVKTEVYMEIANEKKIAGLVQFLRKGRTMTGRFRLPMLEEQAYEYLLAAYIMEVQLRYRRFIYNGFVEEQLKQVANCLTANTAKFGIVLCGGCGNGKTTMLKALQNLVRRLEILKPNLSPNAGHSSDNYYSFTIVNAMQIVQIRKTDYNKFCKLAEADMLGIDDIGTEPAEVQDYGNFMYPIKELLAMRYDAQLFTVFTTNLEPKEIRQRYGDRIADRLNEMMTKVVYRNLTYRTENAQMADSQG